MCWKDGRKVWERRKEKGGRRGAEKNIEVGTMKRVNERAKKQARKDERDRKML